MSATEFRSLALCAFAVLAPLGDAVAQTDKSWIVGEVAPLTGPAATVGTRLNKAVKMWVDDVNAKGGINGRRSIIASAMTKIGLTRLSPVRATSSIKVR